MFDQAANTLQLNLFWFCFLSPPNLKSLTPSAQGDLNRDEDQMQLLSSDNTDYTQLSQSTPIWECLYCCKTQCRETFVSTVSLSRVTYHFCTCHLHLYHTQVFNITITLLYDSSMLNLWEQRPRHVMYTLHTVTHSDSDSMLSYSHLQNPSTDVSAAGLTFHPVLSVVICLTVWHSIPATQNI